MVVGKNEGLATPSGSTPFVTWGSSNFTQALRMSEIEFISWEAGVDVEDVRRYLRQEVDRLSREKAAKHALAHRRLDRRVDLDETQPSR